MTISKRGLLAALGLAGAAIAAPTAQAETDWKALNSTAWHSGGQVAEADGTETDGLPRLAEANPGAGEDMGAAIESAFVQLGMAPQRAACYGQALVENLSPERQQEAATLVRDASSADAVKVSVISGGPEMVGGFSAADAACPDDG